MRALVCEAYGPIESLKVMELPAPEPKAGEVLLKVGAAGVSGLSVGQRVMTGVSQGAYAEYAVATAVNVVPIPETMPYAQATNFPTLYPTAYGALKWKANMQPGEVLLVHGAGGGSGLTGIEV